MTEQWMPIPEWPGYEVSDLGRVRSVARIVQRSNGWRQTIRERILKLAWDTCGDTGHLTVTVYRQRRKVHRLVLTAFVGPAPAGHEGCHNDGDPSNNALSNLRWDTHRANSLDRIKHGRHHLAIRQRCIRGHEFDGLYVSTSGHRRQRTCSKCEAIRRTKKKTAAATRNLNQLVNNQEETPA